MNLNRKHIPNEEMVIEAAKKMRHAGHSWRHIAATLNVGVGKTWFQYRCVPGFRDSRTDERKYRTVGHTVRRKEEPVPLESNRPPLDTRTLDQKRAGDPLPGRSAWDKMSLKDRERVL